MCWCPYYLKCVKGDECGRALTPEVRYAARRERLAIDRFAKEPTCFQAKEESDAEYE